ncbi:ATP-binding protein [Methylobacterium sp. CM6257]
MPRRLDGTNLSTVLERLVASSPDGLPDCLSFDFAKLSFVRPVGVTFLSNLVHWLDANGCKVNFSNLSGGAEALRYLDDSLFFEQHAGAKLNAAAAPRATTKPLRFVLRDEVHGWLRLDLIPWLAARLGITTASLVSFQTCISEVFNNIADHAKLEIGSIFVQHFPNENCIHIAVADFGLGIPASIRRVMPGLTDEEAVVKAVEEGFTSQSTPRNRGAGLDFLLRTVASHNKGTVTIYSSHTVVRFDDPGTGIRSTVLTSRGFCPGTTIDIRLKTDTIEEIEDTREALEW